MKPLFASCPAANSPQTQWQSSWRRTWTCSGWRGFFSGAGGDQTRGKRRVTHKRNFKIMLMLLLDVWMSSCSLSWSSQHLQRWCRMLGIHLVLLPPSGPKKKNTNKPIFLCRFLKFGSIYTDTIWLWSAKIIHYYWPRTGIQMGSSEGEASAIKPPVLVVQT